jgi:predicted transcriptional regulator
MRRYIVTFIDPVSHFAFAVGLPSRHVRYTARALEQGLSLLPQRPTTVLSDNGSEFEADFAQLLEGARHPALVHLPQDAQDERQTRA